MKSNRLSAKLIQYELRNAIGNWFSVFFGIAFPILMSLLITNVFMADLPPEAVDIAKTSVFISMSLVVPMAILLIGYAANYSQELEKEVPLRLKLFGCTEQTILGAKMIANLIFMTIALAIYVAVDVPLLGISVPDLGTVLALIGALYLLSIILFALAHGIATLFGRFGPTYGVTMTLYFGFMILCGMMGVPVNRLPEGLQAVAKALPMTYIGTDFAEIWNGGAYDFQPLILSFVLFGVVSVVILALSIRKRRRTVK